LPALSGGWPLTLPAVPGAATVPPQTGSQPPAGVSPVRVSVAPNCPETVIDLGAVFGAMGGIQHGGGLQFAVLGNTNPGLVQTDLSEALLTLTYTRGQYGTAAVTVGATDADGVSVQLTLVLTVRPPFPAPAPVSMPFANSP
jgi:hypothetical protein